MHKQIRLWEENLFRFVGYPYPIISLLIGIIIFIIYVLFSLTSPNFFNIFHPFQIHHFLQIAALSLLIVLELVGFLYLTNTTNYLIIYLEKLGIKNLHNTVNKTVGYSKLHIVIYILVVSPFIIINYLNGNIIPFYSAEKSDINLSLDIYNNIIEYISLFFLADFLWILLNISWMFEEIRCKPCKTPLKSNIFSLHLKLKPISYSILKILAFYFLVITVAIISYITPFEDIPYQWVILIALLLICGLFLFIIGMGSVRRLLDMSVENELDEINTKRQEQLEKLKNIASEKDYSGRMNEIASISSMMEILHTQEEGIIENYDKAFSIIHYITAIAAFITTSLIPWITLIKSINDPFILSLLPNLGH